MNWNKKNQPHKIKICRANLKRDLRSFSDMVPYVQGEMDGITKKTMIDSKGGKKPAWNQTLQFNTASHIIKLQVYDTGNFSDSLVCSGSFDLNSLPENDNEAAVDLLYDQNIVGKLYIKVLSKPIKINLENTDLFDNPNQSQLKIFENVATNLLGTPSKQNKLSIFQQLEKGLNSPIKVEGLGMAAEKIQAPMYPQAQVAMQYPNAYPPQPQMYYRSGPAPFNSVQQPPPNLYPSYSLPQAYSGGNRMVYSQTPQRTYIVPPQSNVAGKMVMQRIPDSQNYRNNKISHGTYLQSSGSSGGGIGGLIDSINSFF